MQENFQIHACYIKSTLGCTHDACRIFIHTIALTYESFFSSYVYSNKQVLVFTVCGILHAAHMSLPYMWHLNISHDLNFEQGYCTATNVKHDYRCASLWLLFNKVYGVGYNSIVNTFCLCTTYRWWNHSMTKEWSMLCWQVCHYHNMIMY